MAFLSVISVRNLDSAGMRSPQKRVPIFGDLVANRRASRPFGRELKMGLETVMGPEWILALYRLCTDMRQSDLVGPPGLEPGTKAL